MANFLQHEPCPRCGSRDNLARYDDGSAWCFGCAYYEPGSRKAADKAVKRAYKASWTEVATLPPTMVQELLKRGLNESEMALFTYSPSMNRLLFKVGDFCEARSFTEKPKTLSFGQKAKYVVGEGDTVVLVEDIFSALRVGRVTSSMPLFGSVIPKDWLPSLPRYFRRAILWLDADKYGEALKQARTLQLMGLETRVIRTELDPKAYTTEEVKEILK